MEDGMGRRKIVYWLSAIFSALLIFPWGLTQPPLLDDLRNFVFDSFQRAAPRQYDRDAPVRVVGVDDESLAVFGQWPWPRTRLAELTDKLAQLGAAAIAFDFIFAEADRLSFENIVGLLPSASARKELSRLLANTSTDDQIFAKSIAAAPVVLGMTLVASGGSATVPQKAGLALAGDDPAPFLPTFPAIVAPISLLADAARGLGATNWLPDHDQVVRRVPLFAGGPSGLTPSLALEALRIAQGETTYVIRSSNASGQSALGRQTGVNAIAVGSLEIPTGAHGDVRPRYAHSAAARIIPAAAVLQGRVERSEIEGRIVFVGALAAGLGDVRATPLEPATPGVEIHAQIIESLVSGHLLARPDWAAGSEFVVAFLLFALVMILGIAVPPLATALVCMVTIAALFIGSFFLFDRYGLLLDPLYPSATIVCGYAVGGITLWQFERAAKRHVHRAFGKFLSPLVVERLAENPERLVLGGETRELTVLFSDLRNFSALSEGMSAHELTQFMNDYLTPMTDAILDREGTVDKYIGDAIMAFWNAPLDIAAHPYKAVSAALAMRSALANFNEARAAKARDIGALHRPAVMGIGVNVGLCSVGNMGSTRRFDYSILGDAVNLASRLEGASKMFDVDIIASASVREAARDCAWLDLGEVVVVGRSSRTSVFTIAGDSVFAGTAEFCEWRALHDEMRENYESRQFAQAAAIAAKLSAHVASRWRGLYMRLENRYVALARAPAPEDWSPAWILDNK
jgi:adenylate cyclase